MIAPAKFSAERLLAPGDRDFDVYRRLEIEGESTRAVAKEVGLSQTRVVQIRDEVETWVAQQAVSAVALTKQQRTQLAEYKAGLRLDALYALALDAFRQSQGPEIVSELAANGGTTTKSRMSQGKPCYLQLAMRIAAQQSRLPITPLAADADRPADEPACDKTACDQEDCKVVLASERCKPPGADRSTIEAQTHFTGKLTHPARHAAATLQSSQACDEVVMELAAERTVNSLVAQPSPPEEDCSLRPAEQVACAREASQSPIAKPMLHVPCSDSPVASSDVNADFARDLFPVQTDVEASDWPLLDDGPMTRKQRKRRQRMLAELRSELSTG
jgi:hypothetical protein